MIVGDLKLQDFSNLDPQILAQIFLKYIKPDQTFLKLFGKFCRAARAKKYLKQQAKLSLTRCNFGRDSLPIVGKSLLNPF